MPGHGYSYVSDKGYIAFLRDLSQPPWKAITIDAYDAPDQMSAAPLIDAPLPTLWKLMAVWAIARVSSVLSAASPAVIAELDRDWDSVQRRLFHFLGGAAEDKDPAKRAAAGRLSDALLAGQGTAQTGLSHDDEVDFGWSQLKLTSEGDLAADAMTIGLTPLLQEIEATTDALADVLGRTKGQKRPAPRSIRLREALTECSSAFNIIHDEMNWMVAHTPVGPARKALEDLRAPFEALLARFPPPKAEEPAAPADPAKSQ